MTVLGYDVLAEQIAHRGLDVEQVKSRLKSQQIETPSWGYGNSGTRFKVFPYPGAARTLYEKLQDAATVHRFTGVCPSVAIHIPWDKVDDWQALRQYAESLGIRIGAINPNLFQDDAYKLGSLCHPDAGVRKQALEHIHECIKIARAVGSDIISLWLADGTNYPGQDDFRARKHRLQECLHEVYQQLDPPMRLLIEYKFFEPAFYHTDLPDWGVAYAIAVRLGERAQVLVDTGHHPQGTNIEHIVAFLLDEGKLGGFHFNNRKYADDDLIVGSINPFEIFLIYNELVSASEDPHTRACAEQVAYMIDQSHNIEPKVEAMILSVMNIQTAYAKALIVDRARLRSAQHAGDVLEAHRALKEAYETDVRPLLAQVRIEMGLDPDPFRAFRASGYAEKVAQERGVQTPSGSGYPG